MESGDPRGTGQPRSYPLSPMSPDPLEVKDVAWHTLDVRAAVEQLATDMGRGLSQEEVCARLERHGPNRLPEEPRKSAWMRFFGQFHNVLIYVLLAASALTAVLGEWVDTGVILAVVVINAIIGFVQEGKAEEALEGIRKLLSLEAAVLRDGHKRDISAEELVPGDVVLLASGDRVPADLRLIEARNAKVQEAVLTGESVPVDKSTAPVEAVAMLGDRKCMAFSGTLVTSGRLRGVVVATGEHTEIGRIGKMVARVDRISTPLLEKIGVFGRQLSGAILVLSILLFAFAWWLDIYELGEIFLIVVSFAVAVVPEGLPAILTITLALGVQRMARRNAVVRHLPAVETLGSVTVICSDKTGTLTRNEMMVARIVVEAGVLEVTGEGYRPTGDVLHEGMPPSDALLPLIHELGRAALLCNDAEFGEDEDSVDERALQGDPTEGALLVLAEKLAFDGARTHAEHERIDAIPFESENRYMATLHHDPERGRRMYVKGAPERVLAMCSHVRTADGVEALDPHAWQERIDAVASEGFRMLALATREAGDDHTELRHEHVQDELVLLGVVGLIDPPRPEAIAAVERCRRAGISVKMITGDHALTARSIGAQMGIGKGARAVTGREVEEATDEELIHLVADHDVFARSSPEHKLRLLRALQASGEVTAMTGDGVNDAPALKQADIGIAMGIKGSEAAKSAAEIILADDDFATIAHAVEEGRTVYDNLKKTILFLLPTSCAEGLMVVTAVLFAFEEMSITPVQILWVNMITAVTLGLALAFEPSEPGIMDRPPRPRGEPILSAYLFWRVGFVAVLAAIAAQYLYHREFVAGRDPDEARTLAVNTLVAIEVFYLFNARYIHAPAFWPRRLFANRAALAAGALLLVFQGVFTYVPVFQTWFGTGPLHATDWLLATSAGFAIFWIVEIEKTVVRRWRARAD